MHVAKETTLPRAKSYTSIYDFFGSTSFSNILYKKTKQPSENVSVFKVTCGDSVKENIDLSNSMFHTSNRYITSERYRDNIKSDTQSTSTIFYDLDDIAKRHSFHVLHEINTSNVNLLNSMKVPINTNGFAGKSNVIVQECATQIRPRLMPRDSIVTNTKKIKRSFPSYAIISSEIFLRDGELSDKMNRYYDKEIIDRQQKFWSYAKYRTEYTNPIPEEKKHKKKNRGKRTEDPCPCQLFSYTCPCTNKKSLTELAYNNKSLTLTDQITSTPKLEPEKKKETKSSQFKLSKVCTTKENKISNTDYENIKIVQKNDALPTKDEAAFTVDMHTIAGMHTVDVLTTNNFNKNEPTSNIKKKKSSKKHKTIICPNCKENVEVVLSTTDEEEGLKYANSSLYRFKEETFESLNGSKIKANRHKSYIAEDNCDHDPRCELVPACQILPTNNVYLSHKCIRKSPKQPKVIRITKACRHHPPCTVVPSCQRTMVLKNNCEYIPPCLHRPRCVNLPLCVPASINMNYEEPVKILNDIENVVCPHVPRCKYYPECQYDTMGNTLENQVNIVSQNAKHCGYLSEYKEQFVIPKRTCPMKAPALIQVDSTTVCSICDNGKSCQFDGTDLKCNAAFTAKENKETTKESKEIKETNNAASSEAVIYIRDVACQFKAKFSPKQSDQSKMSGSDEVVNMKTGNYYSTVHTLRYEDKFTSPVNVYDSTETSISVISIDSHAHRRKARKGRSERNSGFVPKSNVTPYVAYATHKVRRVASLFACENDELGDGRASEHRNCVATLPVKSRKRFLKSKYKKKITVKRRRKSRASSYGFVAYSGRKPAYIDNA